MNVSIPCHQTDTDGDKKRMWTLCAQELSQSLPGYKVTEIVV